MEFADFAITIGAGREGRFSVSVSSPAGEGKGTFEPPFPPECLAPLLAGLARHVKTEDDGRPPEKESAAVEPRHFGEGLFASLFSGQILDLYNRSLGFVQARQDGGLRIRVHFDPSVPDLAWMDKVPWELLGPPGEPFSLRRETPVVRYLNVDKPIVPVVLEGPLRILVVASSPAGVPALDLAKEKRWIKKTWGRQAGIEVEFLEKADLVALRASLLNRPAQIVHFMGHGEMEDGEGALLFETADGQPERVTGHLLATQLRLSNPPALVVLNACETACWDSENGFDPFAGVATALIKAGLLAVVAMQFPISDQAALAFSEALYRRLAAGDPVEAAVAEGRLAIHARDPRSFEWATPVLFLRTEKVLGAFPFLVPPRIAEQIESFDLYIKEKTSGFIGRQFVFDAIQSFIDNAPRGYFLVRGDPGIGKTSLLAELARKGEHVRHFNIRLQNMTRTEQFLRNACAQIIAKHRLRHAFLPADADRSSAFLLNLLAESASVTKGKKIVVLVDALDEADASGLSPGANLLALPAALPQGVYFVVTSRNLDEDHFPLRIECENETLALEHNSSENMADVKAFLDAHLAAASIQEYLRARRLPGQDFVRELTAKSEGNFMYLRCVLWEIERAPESSRPVDQLPRGLKAYYEDHWRRMRAADERIWIEGKVKVLMALTVTQAPISVEQMELYSGVHDRHVVREVLRDFRPFLHEEGGKLFQLYHASFFEFIKKKDEVQDEHVSFREAHSRVRQAMSERMAERRRRAHG